MTSCKLVNVTFRKTKLLRDGVLMLKLTARPPSLTQIVKLSPDVDLRTMKSPNSPYSTASSQTLRFMSPRYQPSKTAPFRNFKGLPRRLFKGLQCKQHRARRCACDLVRTSSRVQSNGGCQQYAHKAWNRGGIAQFNEGERTPVRSTLQQFNSSTAQQLRSSMVQNKGSNAELIPLTIDSIVCSPISWLSRLLCHSTHTTCVRGY